MPEAHEEISAGDAYAAFLRAKIQTAPDDGFEIDPAEVNPLLKPHQRDIVLWAIRGGRRAIFAAFGLGKSIVQLEIIRLLLKRLGGGRGLIVLPLGVRQEFRRDARMLSAAGPEFAIPLTFVQHTEDVGGDGIYLTNYESIRDRRLDPRLFRVSSLDEAAVLRSFGSKTFGEMLFGPMMTIPYRFVATASPSPNNWLEFIAYAHYLGIMDMGEAKTRFFKRDSEHADHLTLHPHKEEEWWLWIAGWAVVLQKPSDLGPEYSDEGYDLPPLRVFYQEVTVDHSTAGREKNGQGRLLKDEAIGVAPAAREKRETLPARIAKLCEIIAAGAPEDHWLLWHHLEDERRAIEKAVPGVVTIYGTQDPDTRERSIIDFAEGRITHFGAKPVLAGSGCNFQYHCHKAIFAGVNFKFEEFIQAVHRLYRFQQTEAVEVHILHAESERAVVRTLQRKWKQHEAMTARMTEIIRRYGLGGAGLRRAMQRSLGVERQEIAGQRYLATRNDAVLETRGMAEGSVHLVFTSIPFSTQYEYTPALEDFGHTDSADHFWAQMGFLTPELVRVLKPGRVLLVHVKDRVMPGAMTGLGYQTISPFHCEAILHYCRHGLAYAGMATIATDVVRENAQTYRLGWTEKCKDSTRMGFGLSEYLLAFRKAPSDASNGYADEPVRKDKSEYTRGRWQIDAAAVWRSSGNRLLTPEELASLALLPKGDIYRMWRSHCLAAAPYDYEGHVAFAEAILERGALPPDFALVPVHVPKEHGDGNIWTDVVRMRTLNSRQAQRQREQHLCPLPLDIVYRGIELFTAPGEVVYDPFGGVGTVPVCAVEKGRIGRGNELNLEYFADQVTYLKAAEEQVQMPTLFDLLEVEETAEEEEAALAAA